MALLFVPSLGMPSAGGRPSASGLGQDGKEWIGTWATAPQPHLPGSLATFSNQTLRLVVRTSAGGSTVRIRISNAYGQVPLQLGGAHIARRTTAADIDAASDRTLTFGGRPFVAVPAGAMVVSDPVTLDVPALTDLAISLFFPLATQARTSHTLALQTSYVSTDTGNFGARASFPAPQTISSWPFLTGVDVESSPDGMTIVALGSSTTDGDGSTPDANRRWPDVLAERLQHAALRNGEVGILNLGIIGNRLLRDSPLQMRDRFGFGLGESGLKRFERDVLDQPGVRYVVLSLGINDITFPGRFSPVTERVRARDIITGYRELIARAHHRGLRVIGTTTQPFENASAYTPGKDIVREEVNRWIRGSGAFDGVIDFDAVVRDPHHPSRLLPAFDSGDHLHTNDAGYVAMANAIPLSLFEGR